jgi:hypothetical protein
MPNIWKPLTCPCELEIEGEKWIRTIKKCRLHKEYTGQILLNAVRSHNKENSPIEEPGIITFFVSFDFVPDWLKPVAKVPSLEKIREANFNLESMSKYHPVDKEFQYTLSNFLSSSRSVFWYLLNEYSSTFGFKIGKYFTNEEYRKKRMGHISSEAEKFLSGMRRNLKLLKKREVLSL